MQPRARQCGHVCDVVDGGPAATCAIGSDAMYCWGAFLLDTGQSDLASAITTAAMPTSVQLASTGDGFGGVVTGCYIAGDEMSCWGETTEGQIQQQSTPDDYPVVVENSVANIMDYVVGGDHVCVVGATDLECWGRVDLDELDDAGNGGSACGDTFCSTTPIVAANAYTTGVIAAGRAHTCIAPNTVLSYGTTCWGDNASDQLGNAAQGASFSDAVPVLLDGVPLGQATSLALGSAHSCAIVGGQTYCWGADDFGQLGTGGVARMRCRSRRASSFKRSRPARRRRAASTSTAVCGAGARTSAAKPARSRPAAA